MEGQQVTLSERFNETRPESILNVSKNLQCGGSSFLSGEVGKQTVLHTTRRDEMKRGPSEPIETISRFMCRDYFDIVVASGDSCLVVVWEQRLCVCTN